MRPLAWIVHIYTATGAVLAFVASLALFSSNFRAAFICLFWAVIVDATDGWLARRVHASEILPSFDGRKLDDVIDYATFVFVPVLLMWRAGLLPAVIAPVVLSIVLIASALAFANTAAKTIDHFFTGFPSYWNILAFYLFVAGFPRAWNAAILVVLSVFVFVPIRYVYPSRTPTLQKLTLVLTTSWGAVMLWMIWRLPDISRPSVALSLLFPAYYGVLSFALHARAKHARTLEPQNLEP